MSLAGIQITIKTGQLFKINLTQCLRKNHYFKPNDIVNIQKRFKARLAKPNLYYPNEGEILSPSSRFKKLGFYGYFLLLAPIGTFMLGTWQVQRRKWKLDLIETLEHRTKLDPIELPDDLSKLETMEYYPVKVKGTFLYDQEFPIGPRNLIEPDAPRSFMGKPEYGKGFHIVTPFKLSDRDLTILVNRGWVPKNLKTSADRKENEVKGEVEITGYIRSNENRPQFVPSNNPKADMWYYRDVNAMAKMTGASPVYIDMLPQQDFPKFPIAGQTRVQLRNEHLSYIITWYGLSACTAYAWYKQVFQKVSHVI